MTTSDLAAIRAAVDAATRKRHSPEPSPTGSRCKYEKQLWPCDAERARADLLADDPRLEAGDA
jgi:hypothetical protein